MLTYNSLLTWRTGSSGVCVVFVLESDERRGVVSTELPKAGILGILDTEKQIPKPSRLRNILNNSCIVLCCAVIYQIIFLWNHYFLNCHSSTFAICLNISSSLLLSLQLNTFRYLFPLISSIRINIYWTFSVFECCCLNKVCVWICRN